MEHEHEHIHEHEHDHVHTHEHHHDHDHDHHHDHSHSTPGEVSAETIALLKYMVDHNNHHAEELEELAEAVGGEAGHQILHAIEAFRGANVQLEDALKLLV